MAHPGQELSFGPALGLCFFKFALDHGVPKPRLHDEQDGYGGQQYKRTEDSYKSHRVGINQLPHCHGGVTHGYQIAVGNGIPFFLGQAEDGFVQDCHQVRINGAVHCKADFHVIIDAA